MYVPYTLTPQRPNRFSTPRLTAASYSSSSRRASLARRAFFMSAWRRRSVCREAFASESRSSNFLPVGPFNALGLPISHLLLLPPLLCNTDDPACVVLLEELPISSRFTRLSLSLYQRWVGDVAKLSPGARRGGGVGIHTATNGA